MTCFGHFLKVRCLCSLLMQQIEVGAQPRLLKTPYVKMNHLLEN